MGMSAKHVHFPRTTASQRRLLFETWEATGNVTRACQTAHMGRRTFYYWKPRFEQGSYAALEQFESPIPKAPARTPRELEQRVIQLRRQNPTWGKRRIADEVAKANNWVPLVSPNTVRRILIDAALWTAPQPAVKKGGPRPSAALRRNPARRSM